MVKWLVLPLLAVLACGSPDNLVLGGTDSFNGSPAIVFPNIGSAIHGTVNLTNPSTGAAIGKADAIILSDRKDLCAVVQANADYFRTPSDQMVSLVMITPFDALGTFYPGNKLEEFVQYSEILAGAGGGPTNAILNVAVSTGYITVSQLDQESHGSFGLYFGGSPDGQAHLYQGKFKTSRCDALLTAHLP